MSKRAPVRFYRDENNVRRMLSRPSRYVSFEVCDTKPYEEVVAIDGYTVSVEDGRFDIFNVEDRTVYTMSYVGALDAVANNMFSDSTITGAFKFHREGGFTYIRPAGNGIGALEREIAENIDIVLKQHGVKL